MVNFATEKRYTAIVRGKCKNIRPQMVLPRKVIIVQLNIKMTVQVFYWKNYEVFYVLSARTGNFLLLENLDVTL